MRSGLTYGDNLDCVGPLLNGGTDANRSNGVTDQTAIRDPVTSKDPNRRELIEVLLDHGATPNASTKLGVQRYAFWRDGRTSGEIPLHERLAIRVDQSIAGLSPQTLTQRFAMTTVSRLLAGPIDSYVERQIIDPLKVDANGNRLASPRYAL